METTIGNIDDYTFDVDLSSHTPKSGKWTMGEKFGTVKREL